MMRNGRDRRSENPFWATRYLSACFWLGPISGSHQGQRPQRLHRAQAILRAKTGRIHGCTRTLHKEVRFFPCTAGAVHTWPDSEVSECPLHVGFSNRPFGSSTFRPSTTGVLMSLAGSRFSSESALRPFHHGVRRRGGTIYWAALPSDEQQVQADIRTHLIHRPARDIIPPRVELEFLLSYLIL